MIKFRSSKIKIVFYLFGIGILSTDCSGQNQTQGGQNPVTKKAAYEPTAESIAKHPLPDWYKDAKLGIFIHSGLYSVPAWAKGTKKPLTEIIKEGKGEEWFANNPYAEWYLNSLKIKGSSTQRHHLETYGKNLSYFDFVPKFNQEIKKWNPDEWARLFKDIGAGYVVLTTKHHDGFLLWPFKTTNPFIKNYQARRDIVGELTTAVRNQGLHMGLYYSSGLDWTFNTKTITNFPALFQAIPQQKEYAEYIDKHWRELIDKYKPSVLWADIGSPWQFSPLSLIADYYNKVPDGIVNDRHKFAANAKGFGSAVPSDIITPEYKVLDTINLKKWETCRGIGLSFGYNQTEDVNEFLSVNDLIDGFIDIVSKNGNLLLNVGPRADGSIPEGQLARLRGLGDWLKINGEAIYATRPWTRATAQTSEGGRVRFTRKDKITYVFLLDEPSGNSVTIKDLKIDSGKKMTLIDGNVAVSCKMEGADLKIELPVNHPKATAYAFKID